jgi:hypothetical protein
MHAVIKAVSNRKGPQVQVVGTVDLEDGAAVPSNRRVARILQGVQVEGDDRKPLGLESGDAYVRALPKAVKGTHVAELVEDEEQGEPE